MFDNFSDEEERGQVGIGTLIVFIAMVLVAAIAAGVLINTAGFLQTKSEETGMQSSAQVTDRVQVSSETAMVAKQTVPKYSINLPDDPEVEFIGTGTAQITVAATGSNLNITGSGAKVISVADGTQAALDVSYDGSTWTVTDVSSGKQLSSSGQLIVEQDGTPTGSDPIGTVTLNGESVDVTTGAQTKLTLADAQANTFTALNQLDLAVSMGAGSNNIDLSSVTIEYIGPNGVHDLTHSKTKSGEGHFTVTKVMDEDDSKPVLDDIGDRMKISIKLSDSDAKQPDFLHASDEATLRITTASGATTTVQISAPDTLGGKVAVKV